MFRIAGSGLNWAFIVPSLDLIALRTGRANNAIWADVEREFLEKLFDSIIGYAPAPGIVADKAHPGNLLRTDGSPFFMCGPGDPEGFLYRGALNPDGTRDGDQMELIWKMSGTGANCIYLMAVRSHGGDGDATENPFIGNDPSKGINMAVLDQWETWFTEMEKNGIVIVLYLYDDSALVWDTGDVVGGEERSFIRILADRFGHHDNLVWCIAEEYQEKLTPLRASAIAATIRAADRGRHPIAVHKLHGLNFSEFADDPSIDTFAIQYNVGTPDSLHQGMVKARRDAAGRYSVIMAEAAEHGRGEMARRKSWASAMAGAQVMVLGMDIAETPVSDLEDCGRLAEFFESADWRGMEPHDELAAGGTQYVLAEPGKRYIAYASDLQGGMGVSGLASGDYTLSWFDCATGARVTQLDVRMTGRTAMFAKPPGIGRECAVYVVRE